MEEYHVSVEVDHSRLVPVASLGVGNAGSIELTTIAPYQRRAVINVYAESEREKTPLKTFDVDRVPKVYGRSPRLELHVRVDRLKRIHLNLDVEGTRYESTVLPGGGMVSGTSMVPAAAAALVLVALLVGAYFIWSGAGALGPASPEQAERTEESAIAREDTGGTATAGSEEARADSEAESDTESASNREATAAADRSAQEQAAEKSEEAAEAEDGRSGEAAAQTSDEEATEAGADERDAESEEAAVTPQQTEWTVYFGPDSAELTGDAREALKEIAGTLRRAEGSLMLEGHCALFGTEQGRERLSRARAQTVRRFLLQEGLSLADDSRIEAAAGREPVTEDPDRQQLNRRVELSFESAQ
jgi:outer membrane protein OmpA-like peptidoglycan-associated protein